MTAERWRLFVAVPIGPALRDDLAAAVGRWRQRPDLAGLRWADPAGWHVTLAFLGSVESSMVPGLAARLADVAAAHAPMDLRTGRVGGFPSASRARVAWYGVDDCGRLLAALARAVRRALGVDAASPFRAHVTLGRADGEPIDVRRWREEADAPIGELALDRLELMRSQLGRGRPRYEVIASVPVGLAAHI